MGSAAAQAMGMNVQPGSMQDMVRRQTAVGTITANKFAADDIAGFLNDLSSAGAPLKDFAGVYNPRTKRGGGGWSQHAYGNAVDIERSAGSGPDNSAALYAWAQAHPKEFAEIQAKHHMRNLDTSSGARMHDWGHFEWTPAGIDKTKTTSEPYDLTPGGGGPPAPGGGAPRGPIPPVRVSGNNVDPGSLYDNLVAHFDQSSLKGFVPKDGPQFGIHTGSPQEWARTALALGMQESSLRVQANETGFGGHPAGLFQFGAVDLQRRGLGTDITNVNNQIKAMVGEFEKSRQSGMIRGHPGPRQWTGAAAYFGPVRQSGDLLKHMQAANQVAQAHAATASQYVQTQQQQDRTAPTAVDPQLVHGVADHTFVQGYLAAGGDPIHLPASMRAAAGGGGMRDIAGGLRRPGAMQRPTPGGRGPGWHYDENQGWTYSLGGAHGALPFNPAHYRISRPVPRPTRPRWRDAISPPTSAGRNLARPRRRYRSAAYHRPDSGGGAQHRPRPDRLAGANHALNASRTHRRIRARSNARSASTSTPRRYRRRTHCRQTARAHRERDSFINDRHDDNKKPPTSPSERKWMPQTPTSGASKRNHRPLVDTDHRRRPAGYWRHVAIDAVGAFDPVSGGAVELPRNGSRNRDRLGQERDSGKCHLSRMGRGERRNNPSARQAVSVPHRRHVGDGIIRSAAPCWFG
jgi:hypothetical protein